MERTYTRPAPKTPSAGPVPDTEDQNGRAGRTADPSAPTGRRRTRRVTDPKCPREPGSRPWTPPRSETGLRDRPAHARAWHAEHGHLAAPRDTLHDGHPLGLWLFSQRNRAKQRARAGMPPSPHLTEITAIDPWWNPPWDLHWQRNYYRARDHIAAGEASDPGRPHPRTEHRPRRLDHPSMPEVRPAPPRPTAPAERNQHHRPDSRTAASQPPPPAPRRSPHARPYLG
ncbi:helicase associated domain-containing protein [Streptomyces sp. S465]|uniref:helicase associated domain-containing protein n=1 Tax=Streptomyces sp. S465 TaxID=2979468 RepID=UPI0022A8A41F|nr:helicase associated domain-containing protein [Streptomyces sp. S465]WAP60657.1 helicase associated domain-containing protein [Streptomyces sp. S465]